MKSQWGNHWLINFERLGIFKVKSLRSLHFEVLAQVTLLHQII